MSRRACGLTAVAGLEVGHFTDTRRPTGCTVISPATARSPASTCAALRPGTRETELLARSTRSRRCTRSLLAGGSAFGLDAAGGVMRWLDERGIGVADRHAGRRRRAAVVVPIVPAAILFDLWVGDARIRPDAAAGYAACEAATRDAPAEGNVGAGAGASVGKLFGIDRAMKGGIGTRVDRRSAASPSRALVAVNAIGDVVDPRTGRDRRRRAQRRRQRSCSARCARCSAASCRRGSSRAAPPARRRRSRVVATDAVLTKAEATKVAQMAHDGLARSINPVHTMGDGDVVFALAHRRERRAARRRR